MEEATSKLATVTTIRRIASYKDLEIWQEGIRLVKITYAFTAAFPKEELYGLTSQMRRAVVSIPSNIAEGCARRSRNEYRQFLYVALGSLAEFETLWVIAKELGRCETVDERVEPIVEKLRAKILTLLRRLS